MRTKGTELTTVGTAGIKGECSRSRMNVHITFGELKTQPWAREIAKMMKQSVLKHGWRLNTQVKGEHGGMHL